MTRPRLNRKKRLLLLVILVLIPYLAVEAAASSYAWFHGWDHSYAITEDTGQTIAFDPVRGYRLGTTPARTARITDGRLEWVGTLRGNAQGFASWYDFGPKRQKGFGARLAVFGDSFSHAPYLSCNWTDRARELTAEQGQPVEFLNFSLSYTGLGNWWSILTRVVEAENYELDGVILVVWETDLLRSFTVQALPEPRRPYQKLLFGRVRSWDPQAFPATAEQACQFLEEDKMQYLLPRDEFERALQGEWPRPVPRHFRPVILTKLYRSLRALRAAPPPPSGETPGEFDDGRKKLIADMRRFLDSRRLPALVVHLPSRDTLLHPTEESAVHLAKSRRFAADLGGAFLDGGAVFANLGTRELRDLFLPWDGHWNQKGSDRFADFIVENLGVLGISNAGCPRSATPEKPGDSPGSPGH
jgi:hypothetical protein